MSLTVLDTSYRLKSSQPVLTVKKPPANAGDVKRRGFDPSVRKIPWRKAWQPTPVFLPRESPWTEEPGRLQSMGSQRVRHGGNNSAHTHTQPYYIPMVYSISRLPKWLLHSLSVPRLSIIPLHWWSCLWFIEKIKVTRIQFPHSSPHLSCPNIQTCIIHPSKSRSSTFALDPVPFHLPRVLALAINPFLLSDIYASLATGSLPSACRHASLSFFSLKI